VAGPIRISILADGRKAKSEAKDVGASLSDSLGKGLAAVKGLPALAAGAAVGGLLVKGLTDALDLEDARGKLQAQLGLSGPESAKAGKIAGDLYKGAYGESIGDVNDMLKSVFQSGLATIGDAESKISGITEKVATYSQMTGEDAVASTRAVSQILRNGLAKDADHAFDVLVRGVQLGVDKSEDLLDTFNEYGTQFRKLGLSADDALGLMNQLLRGGARDADTAADAIKEFSIRAIDGSKSTATGFKAIGLDADVMAQKIAKGGPTARTAFGQILTELNGIKDPVKREAAGVALFGTKWEDLGAAIKSANLSTAAKSLGDVAGSTDRANDAMTTTSTKLKGIGRTIQFSIADAITKYALPKLNEFATWFSGPGKFVIARWAVAGAKSIVDFAIGTLGALEALTSGLAKYSRVSLIAAAAGVAVFNPNLALNLLNQADALDEWATNATTDIERARGELKNWSTGLDKLDTRIEFEGDIADLDAKIATAQKQLRDPTLTATKRATLTATIAELERKKSAAVVMLQDPKLVAARTAKLSADSRSLDRQIAAAKVALADPKLTATKRAKLDATIAALLEKKREAQAAVNALKGKVVPITMKISYVGGALKGQNSDPTLGGLVKGSRASGGPVTPNGAYLVGENGPELVTFGAAGFVHPNKDLDPAMLANGIGRGAVVVNVYALADGPEVGRRVVSVIQDYENFNGASWRGAA
jgi:hypothetical protein